jgi:hypothetical protein
MVKIVPYDLLPVSDLHVDAVYEGAAGSQLIGEALSKLLPGVGNQGGFRAAGMGEDKKFVALFSSGEDQDWPDYLDLSTGQFTYYGDNKKPGQQIGFTQRGGNKILERIFALLHSNESMRHLIPPFFIFTKYVTKTSSRSFQFKGLAVPGYPGLSPTSDLIAVWKTTGGQRFQNYRATFTILDIPIIDRKWLHNLTVGMNRLNAPSPWMEWIDKGKYKPLVSEKTKTIRTIEEQTPDTSLKKGILQSVWSYFKDNPIGFEHFAARIYQMHDQRVIIDQITRSSVDGGRDAIGRYLLGVQNDPIFVQFALEAKCYRPPLNGASPTTVGVREVSRLISRIRQRQFGVLVTTSVVAKQAYEEVREDGHPIIILCGKDITEILITAGYNDPNLVSDFLRREFA